MTSEQFCYWLQGMFELVPDIKVLNEVQTQMIRDHLRLVFTKVTPDRTGPNLDDIDWDKVLDPIRKKQEQITSPYPPSFPPTDIIC